MLSQTPCCFVPVKAIFHHPYALWALIQSRHYESYSMPRSDEAANFFAAVYQAVQEIPHGKVTSYGHIARLIGHRKCSSPTAYLSTKTD